MAFRIFIVILVLAAGYACYEIYFFKSFYHGVENPRGQFQVMGPEKAETTVVEFIDYTCSHCKTLHPRVMELLTMRPDLRYVARPVPLMGEESEKVARLAYAAGLQGRFWEFHNAFLEKPDDINDEFIQETAELYGIDYEQMVQDSTSRKVDKIYDDNIKAFEKAGMRQIPSFIIEQVIYEPRERLPEVSDLVEIISKAENAS